MADESLESRRSAQMERYNGVLRGHTIDPRAERFGLSAENCVRIAWEQVPVALRAFAELARDGGEAPTLLFLLGDEHDAGCELLYVFSGAADIAGPKYLLRASSSRSATDGPLVVDSAESLFPTVRAYEDQLEREGWIRFNRSPAEAFRVHPFEVIPSTARTAGRGFGSTAESFFGSDSSSGSEETL